MRRGVLAGLAILVALLAAAGVMHWVGERALQPRDAWIVPSATPPDITLQLPARQYHTAVEEKLILADAQGLSLYAYAHDRPGRATCTGACRERRPPAIAPPGATATGAWSILSREDGARQWVYAGAPLYRFVGDRAPGETQGVTASDATWRVARFDPGGQLQVPDGISVQPLADAGGVGLVDSAGMTLYIGSTSMPCRDDPVCERRWPALPAAQIAQSVGEFALRQREDGITQWMFRARPLYRFAGDQRPGDTRGSGVDPRFHVALIARFFMPAGVTLRERAGLGSVLATTSDATLYQRDRVNPDDSHNFRLDHGSAVLGRAFGTSTCDAACTQQWHPLLAAAGASACGFWELMRRTDGHRQWAYKGFALYTYAADHPGEARGNESYELAPVVTSETPVPTSSSHLATFATTSIDQRVIAGNDVSGIGVSALFWHATTP